MNLTHEPLSDYTPFREPLSDCTPFRAWVRWKAVVVIRTRDTYPHRCARTRWHAASDRSGYEGPSDLADFYQVDSLRARLNHCGDIEAKPEHGARKRTGASSSFAAAAADANADADATSRCGLTK